MGLFKWFDEEERFDKINRFYALMESTKEIVYEGGMLFVSGTQIEQKGYKQQYSFLKRSFDYSTEEIWVILPSLKKVMTLKDYMCSFVNNAFDEQLNNMLNHAWMVRNHKILQDSLKKCVDEIDREIKEKGLIQGNIPSDLRMNDYRSYSNTTLKHKAMIAIKDKQIIGLGYEGDDISEPFLRDDVLFARGYVNCRRFYGEPWKKGIDF